MIRNNGNRPDHGRRIKQQQKKNNAPKIIERRIRLNPFDIINSNYFKNQHYGFFIECGAADGVTNSVCLPFEKIGWSGINIEASNTSYSELVKNRQNLLNINAALSNKSGTTKFLEPVGAHEYSAINMHSVYQSYFTKLNISFIEYDVVMMTYRDIVTQHNVKSLDLMVLDVEGSELNAIEGMVSAPILPTVMCIEYPICGLDKLKTACATIQLELDFVSYNNAFFSNRKKIKKPKNPVGETEIMPLSAFFS